jgi:hypothetical protein
VTLARSHDATGPAARSRRSRRSNPIPAWLVLVGALLPVEASIYVADVRFTPPRLIFIFLLLPALFVLFRKGRLLVISDLLVFVTAAWMVYAGYSASTLSLSSAGAEALELFGGYVVGRAFFFDRSAIENFVRTLKAVMIVLIGLGVADMLSGRFFAHDFVAGAFHVQGLFPTYRSGWIRATSTLDHPISYGVFCTFAVAIFLYAEQRSVQRLFFVVLCAFGCMISQSSAAYLSLALVLAVYSYDRLLMRFHWRWQLMGTALATFIALIFLLSNKPVSWLVSHLTLDPETGYFRIMIWDVATAQIALSPIVGFGFVYFNNEILDNTVDAIWLVMSLRFGVPMAALLLLTTFATFIFKGRYRTIGDSYIDQVRTGFTIVLVTYLIVGLTVHFWNYMWIFWGLCAGIRASLYEREKSHSLRPVSPGAFADEGIHIAGERLRPA